MYYMFKITDSSDLAWYIITNEQEICVSKISSRIQDCIKTINNPNGYNSGKIIHEVYPGEKAILCVFKNPEELINLIPEEFL